MKTYGAVRRLVYVFVAIWVFPLAFAHALPPVTALQAPGASGEALAIPLDHLLQPKELSDLLQKPTLNPPLVLQVGSHVLFAEAHIVGSEYVGPGAQSTGLDALSKRVATVPKDRFLVIYCGCCPWARCPNIGAAYQKLKGMGFTNVKVLYIANNFGDDWVAKGYRVEKGR